MHAQILQIRLAEHGAHGVGHTADAQLETGAVGDLLHDELRHRPIHLRGCAGGQDAHGVVAPLHHHIHLADVDAVVEAAQTAGHILVDLYDDHLGHLTHCLQVGRGQAEIEVAVLIHGCDLEHGHIRRRDMVVVVAGQLGIAHRLVEARAAGDMVALHAAHVVGVIDNMMHRVLNVKDRRLPQADAASDLHILQLRCAASQRLVQHAGVDGTKSVVHPVAGLDDLDRLIRGGQLLTIHFLIICKWHSAVPHFPSNLQLLILPQRNKK